MLFPISSCKFMTKHPMCQRAYMTKLQGNFFPSVLSLRTTIYPPPQRWESRRALWKFQPPPLPSGPIPPPQTRVSSAKLWHKPVPLFPSDEDPGCRAAPPHKLWLSCTPSHLDPPPVSTNPPPNEMAQFSTQTKQLSKPSKLKNCHPSTEFGICNAKLLICKSG